MKLYELYVALNDEAIEAIDQVERATADGEELKAHELTAKRNELVRIIVSLNAVLDEPEYAEDLRKLRKMGLCP